MLSGNSKKKKILFTLFSTVFLFFLVNLKVYASGSFDNPSITPNDFSEHPRASTSVFAPIIVTFPNIQGDLTLNGTITVAGEGVNGVISSVKGNSVYLAPTNKLEYNKEYNLTVTIPENILSSGVTKCPAITKTIKFKTEYNFDTDSISEAFKTNSSRALNIYVNQYILNVSIVNAAIAGDQGANFDVVNIEVNKNPLVSRLELTAGSVKVNGIPSNNGKEEIFSFAMVNLPADTDIVLTAYDSGERELQSFVTKNKKLTFKDKDYSNGGKPYNMYDLINNKGTFGALLKLKSGVTMREKVYLGNVSLSLIEGKLTGTDGGMEYSLDATSSTNGSWKPCTSPSTDNMSFIPGKKIYLRETGNPSNFRVISIPTSKVSAPKFTIDFANEKTKEAVTTTMEWSEEESFKNSTTGNGSEISLLPGKTYYIRYKATLSEVPSQAFKLVVPVRPKAPAIKVDYSANTAAVASNIEAKVEGDLNFTQIPSGQKTYSLERGKKYFFRVKATASAFASDNFEVLYSSNSSNLGDLVIDYSKETINIPTDIEYSYDKLRWVAGKGIFNIQPDKEKTLYYRKKLSAEYQSEIKELKIPARPQINFTIDFENEIAKTSDVIKDNEIEYRWNDINGAYTKLAGSYIIPLNPENKEKVLYIRRPSTDSSFAAKGVVTLRVPARPVPPKYNINYLTEATAETVPLGVEYEVSDVNTVPVNSFSGKALGKPVSLEPSADKERYIFFRVAASSKNFKGYTFVLTVPKRVQTTPPQVTIDYMFEQTNESIQNSVEYSEDEKFTTKKLGEGKPIKLTPGKNIYLRYKSDGKSFASKSLMLTVPGIQSKISLNAIDYIKETIDIPSSCEYSTDINFTKDVHTGAANLKLTPGVSIYVRTKASLDKFAGDTEFLQVSARAAAPNFMVDSFDLNNLKTVQVVPTTYEYYEGTKEELSTKTFISGTDGIVSLVKGKKYCFRKKAIAGSAFAGEIQELEAK